MSCGIFEALEGKGIEMRDLCRQRCSFISLLQSECTLRWVKKKQARCTKRFRSYSFMCFSYLDIHFKQHLNQAFLNGPHPLLIKSQTAQDKLICLKNGGDINSAGLWQWPLLLFVLNPSSTSLYLNSLEIWCIQSPLSLLFSLVLLPPSLLSSWYKHPGSRQEHHQHARCAGVMQIASVLVMEGTAIDTRQEMAATEGPLFG